MDDSKKRKRVSVYLSDEELQALELDAGKGNTSEGIRATLTGWLAVKAELERLKKQA